MDKIDNAIHDLINEQLKTLRNRFDFIIFDCAPGISLLTEAAIRAADMLILPTVPDYLSILALDVFLDNAWNQASANGRNLPRRAPFVLITRKRNIGAHNKGAKRLRELAQKPGIGFKLLETVIPEHPNVPIAIEKTATDYPLYRNLWGDLISYLEALEAELTERLKD
jgi:cellulose biosynthesis protein BcsQ